MSEQKRRSKPGYETAYWCCSAEFGEHDLDCPNHVEAAPRKAFTDQERSAAWDKAVAQDRLTEPLPDDEQAAPKDGPSEPATEAALKIINGNFRGGVKDCPQSTIDYIAEIIQSAIGAAQPKAVAEPDREMLTEAMIILKALALSVTWELAPAIRDRIADICKRYEERLSQPVREDKS